MPGRHKLNLFDVVDDNDASRIPKKKILYLSVTLWFAQMYESPLFRLKITNTSLKRKFRQP